MVICKSLVQQVKDEWWDLEHEAGLLARGKSAGLTMGPHHGTPPNPDGCQAPDVVATWPKVTEAHFLLLFLQHGEIDL